MGLKGGTGPQPWVMENAFGPCCKKPIRIYFRRGGVGAKPWVIDMKTRLGPGSQSPSELGQGKQKQEHMGNVSQHNQVNGTRGG